MEEAEEARAEQRQPERASQNYARGAVPTLVPMLLEALCKQEVPSRQLSVGSREVGRGAGMRAGSLLPAHSL